MKCKNCGHDHESHIEIRDANIRIAICPTSVYEESDEVHEIIEELATCTLDSEFSAARNHARKYIQSLSKETLSKAFPTYGTQIKEDKL